MKKPLSVFSVLAFGISSLAWGQLGRVGATTSTRVGDQTQLDTTHSNLSASSSAHLHGTTGAHLNGISTETTGSSRAHITSSTAGATANLKSRNHTADSANEKTTAGSTQGRLANSTTATTSHFNASTHTTATGKAEETTSGKLKGDAHTQVSSNAGLNTRNGDVRVDSSTNAQTSVR